MTDVLGDCLLSQRRFVNQKIKCYMLKSSKGHGWGLLLLFKVCGVRFSAYVFVFNHLLFEGVLKTTKFDCEIGVYISEFSSFFVDPIGSIRSITSLKMERFSKKPLWNITYNKCQNGFVCVCFPKWSMWLF